MKKILILLVSIICLISCQCQTVTSLPIVGHQYEVTSVKVAPSYGYKYEIEMKCLDSKSNVYTFNGNHHTFYTNEIYTVGDTITIK